MLAKEERKIQSEIHGRLALEHIQRICKSKNHYVGTEGERQVLEYFERHFREYGLLLEHTPIRVPTYKGNGTELVLTDTGTKLQTISPYFTAPCAQGGSRGPGMCWCG